MYSPDLEAFLALDFRAAVVAGDFKAYEIRARQPGATHTEQKRERGRQRGVKRERRRGRERETVSVGWCCKTCIFAVGNALKYAAHFMRHDVNWAQGRMEGVQRIRGAAARCVGPRGVEFPTQVS